MNEPRKRESIWLMSVILVVAAVAWLGMFIWARDMSAVPGTMGMTLPAFVLMWTLMMAAMMLPSAIPTIVYCAWSIRTNSWLDTTTFGAGYILAWGLTGIPAFILAWLTGWIVNVHPAWATAAALIVFAEAGIYQLSTLKRYFLNHCRTPDALPSGDVSSSGSLRSPWAGAHHGLYCLGSCWGLMMLMFLFGVMNLVAMTALTAVIAVEKHWSRGERFARATGLGLLVLAATVLFVPDLAIGLDPRGRVHDFMLVCGY